MRHVKVAREPLVVDRLTTGLRGTPLRVEVLATCPSTNTVLAQRVADGGARDLQVLVTEHQMAGLGRLGRSFVTPDRAALTFSLALTPVGTPAATWGWVTLLTGWAAARAVRATTGVDARLKWPNDVLVTSGPRPGKLAGILATATATGVVVGIGLNVSQAADELPVPGATSLTLAGAGPVDRTDLLVAILTGLVDVTARWRATDGDAGAAGLAAQVSQELSTLGRRVRVELPGGREITGVAQELAPGGELVVRDEAGASRVIAAGDVHHLRDL